MARWGFDEVEVVHHDPEAIHPLWVRPRVGLPDDPALHAAAIAFISDMALVMVVHEAVGDPHATPLTVDHTIWFHGVPRFDDWLYLDASLSTRHDRARPCRRHDLRRPGRPRRHGEPGRAGEAIELDRPG